MTLVAITPAAHVRIGLGHWATPMFENYKTPLFDVHEMLLAFVAYFAILIAAPLWAGLLIFRRLLCAALTSAASLLRN